jgi:hypothetical protein
VPGRARPERKHLRPDLVDRSFGELVALHLVVGTELPVGQLTRSQQMLGILVEDLTEMLAQPGGEVEVVMVVRASDLADELAEPVEPGEVFGLRRQLSRS